MVKKLAFLFSARDLESIDTNSYKLVPLTEDASLALLKRKLKFYDFNKYFSQKNKYEITRKSHYWATHWLKRNTVVLSCFNLSLDHYFSKTLYNYECILNLIKKEKPSEVYIGKERGSLSSHFFFNHESVKPIIFAIAKQNKIKVITSLPLEMSAIRRFVQFLYFPSITFDDFSNNIKDKRILILANHYHISSIMPLINKLPKKDILLIGKVGGLGKLLREKGVGYVDFHDQVYIWDILPFLIWKIRLLFSLRLIRSDIYKYGGVNLFPVFKDKLVSVAVADSLLLLTHYFLAKRLLKKLPLLSVLALTNDSRNQIWIKLANFKKIPTYELQHGLNFGHDYNYQVANIYIAWGEATKKLLLKNKSIKSNVTVGGWPKFDELKSVNRPYKPLGSSKKLLRLLFLAHEAEGFSAPYGVNKGYGTLFMFYSTLRQLHNGVLAKVRLHPRSSIQIPKTLAKISSNKIDFDTDGDIINSINKCDIVVGQTTTATLLGLLSGKPTIYLPSMKWPDAFLENSGVFTVFDQKSLVEAIDKIRSGRNFENSKKMTAFLSLYCSTKINSSLTIANLLLGKK